jgi:phage FluMu protein Com
MFVCEKCNKEVANVKMVEIIVELIGREKAIEKKVNTTTKSKFLAMTVNEFRIKCPSCQAESWDYV